MRKDENWFAQFRESSEYQTLKDHPVVYLCAEFALDERLPIYAGGLGVLAGDLIHEAYDQHFPLIAVGLYYYNSYGFRGEIEQSANTQERNFADIGLQPVLDEEEKRLIIEIPIENRIVKVQAWLYEDNSTPVYLLDTNLTENSPEDRSICDFLYSLDRETRIKQEMVLGIGGYRLFESLNIYPSLYHLNEGHSAFLSLEVIRAMMRAHGVSFEQAVELAKKKIIFSNHTLLYEGQDFFQNELAEKMLRQYAKDMQVSCSKILELGKSEKPDLLSMTTLSLRTAGITNAVSKIHAEKANQVWLGYSMIPVTNGIHIPTWDKIQDDFDLWKSHQELKKETLAFINEAGHVSWDENVLLIGWARRFVNYKRPLAIFEDVEGFLKLAKSEKYPVRVVMAGLAHPADTDGVAMVKKIKELAAGPLKGYLVFIDDYDRLVASKLVSGCDIWLNTPHVGYEACGTSGMKAALNGALTMSTKDGWVAEVDLGKIGFELDTNQINASIIGMLTEHATPLFSERDQLGVPTGWLEIMKTSRVLIEDDFSSGRMLKDYIEQMYLKLIQNQ